MSISMWKIPPILLAPSEVDRLYLQLTQRLQQISSRHQHVRFATSLAAEDMVITDVIASQNIPIEIFTLNTGRLHQDTLDMYQVVQEHYAIRIQAVEPDTLQVNTYIQERGLNAFYESEEAKKACCAIRKVIPLNKALVGADAWLTGQRREQAVTRTDLEFEEFDDDRNIAKYNPIFDLSEKQMWSYLQTRQVPIHPLHKKGYPSIGCEPCTRAVKEGEDIRAGRWWWLQQDSKECGLHVMESTEK